MAGIPSELGDFQIRGLLGEGGGGLVYAAEGPAGEVALKVPHADRELTERDRARYLAEAEMMGRVRHPCIVEVLDSGTLPDGRPFVAMPRLEGRTLAERVYEEGPFPLEPALALFQQLADATSALHRVGLLHRDLKPENVFLLEGDARVKLLDFGIAKDRRSSRQHTTTGMVRGTPATMAPERFFGAQASEASDVYELAVVLYVMLVGRLPWSGEETDIEARARPLAPHATEAGVSASVSAAIMRALSTRPAERPATPAALAKALAHATEPPSPSLATVTSPHLRQLVAHPTPFEASLVSSREPRARSARSTWLAVAGVVAAALVLGRTVLLPAEPAAAATSQWAERGGAIAQGLARDAASPASDHHVEVTGEPGDDAESVADAASADPQPQEAAAERSRRGAEAAEPTPATAPTRPEPAQPSAGDAEAPADAPAPSASMPLPGGLYDTSPYE